MLPELLVGFDHYKDPYAIAKLYFNTLRHETFPEQVRRMLDGVGLGSEYNGIWFPDGLDESEERFTGVKFTRLDEELLVNEGQFLKLLEEASVAFSKMYPNRFAEIAPMLEEIKTRLKR